MVGFISLVLGFLFVPFAFVPLFLFSCVCVFVWINGIFLRILFVYTSLHCEFSDYCRDTMYVLIFSQSA